MDRARRVVSIEHDAGWIAWVRERIPRNVELVPTQRGPATVYCAPLAGLDESFDVTLVDGRHRNEAFEKALDHLNRKGMILLDDSHRPRYAPPSRLLTRPD